MNAKAIIFRPKSGEILEASEVLRTRNMTDVPTK